MKKELLSPVGSMEALYQAIHNGADAVYLGGKKFGARMYADNFDKDGLKKAIDYCHLYGVKIYITVNTVIFDKEVEEFLEYIKYLYVSGVDAVIMQDIGMISLVREMFPDLEIHASTQTHNHNSEGIKLLKSLGVSRIVLARELSLKEIKDLDVDVEKEIFIHGALCVCYSGCCLFSSMNSNRSGNRGECVASCRLPYRLYQNNEEVKTNGKYLLSMKELNTIANLKDILESDVVSLKIEGRMKSPEYVGYITRIYRKLIDKYYNGEELIFTNEESNNLKALFNREFTTGYLFRDYGKGVMNIKNQNHIGLEIGKVIEVNNKYIKIKLDHELNQEDGIKFLSSDKGMIVNKLYNKKMLLVNSIPKGDIAIVDNKVGLKDMTKVSVTIDKKLLQQLNRYEEKKIKIIFEVIAKSDEYLQITITDGINKIETKGEKLQKSITTPITKENIIKQLSKLGNTPFELEDIKIYMDPNIFISLKELNDIRRNLVEQLIEKRTYVPQKRINYVESLNTSSDKPVKISALVRTEEQLLACLDNNINYIYVTDTVLFNKYSNYSNIYLRMPRVMDNYKEMEEKNILACELGTVWKYSNNNNVCTDYYLNINNNNSIKTLEKLGVKRICLSPEIREFDKISSTSEVEMIVYGRLELMITKYCPLNMILNNDSKKCTVCMKKDKFYIKDDQNRMYPLLHNKHITHVMHYKNIDLIDNILEYKNKNINCFRLELFEENYLQTSNLISTMKGRLYE